MLQLMSTALNSVVGTFRGSTIEYSDRLELANLTGSAQVVFFDFDGTLTATPGDRASRPSKTKELCQRAEMLQPKLQQLRDADIMLGIISKSTEGTVTACLEAANLRELFNGPIVGKAVGFDGKAGYIRDFTAEDGPLAHLGADGLHLVVLVDDDLMELERCREASIQTYAAPDMGGLTEDDFKRILIGVGAKLDTELGDSSSSGRASSGWGPVEESKVTKIWTQGLTGQGMSLDTGVDYVEYEDEDVKAFTDLYSEEEVDGEGGRGAFGDCAIRTSKLSGKRVIVKFVKQQDLGRRQIDYYFDKDCGVYASLLRMTREMPHKNIVHYFDFLAGPNWVRGVMEALNGPNLFTHLQESAPVNEAYIREVMSQALSGLDHLHSKVGLMHRDVKIENLRFRRPFKSIVHDAELVLVDFGFCCNINPEKEYKEVVGTLPCMAPEVFSHCYAAKSDMWSAGVLLYMLLAGKPPWSQNPKNDGSSMIQAKQCERAVAVALRSPEIADAPEAAVTLLDRLLVVDPESRCSAGDALGHHWFSLGLPPTPSAGGLMKTLSSYFSAGEDEEEEAGQLLHINKDNYEQATKLNRVVSGDVNVWSPKKSKMSWLG
mmetsp:Transcript_143701/g.264953  ORF Transcript_143701/g.264953 Transcript_143701/m.264953 type:complete len:603 (-) Transcript_143701:85-1893(-)